MKPQLVHWYEELNNSLWFVPMIMALCTAGAAVLTLSLDRTLDDTWWRDASWIWTSSATGARTVLATVVGSIITVVSIVFSITVTALAQMSAQFGPRLLRSFTSDRGNQITLGTFIATFIYCLLVLRTIRDDEYSTFVPHLSINIGIALAIISLAVLIYFIHHVSQNIQAENLIAEVGHDFEHLLPTLYPEHIGHEEPDANLDEADLPTAKQWDEAYQVTAKKSGYIQGIEDGRTVEIAREHGLVLLAESRPGDFVTRGTMLARAWPPEHVDEQVAEKLRGCFSLGHHRTQFQDLSYPMQQLVEIAARALSPAVNEPHTALTCIDWLGAMLRGVVSRKLPLPLRYDQDNQLRVITRPLQFEELAVIAFEQIRIYGSNNPMIIIGLLNIIADLVPYLCRKSDCQTLIYHTHLIGEDARQSTNEAGYRRIEARLQATLHRLHEWQMSHPTATAETESARKTPDH